MLCSLAAGSSPGAGQSFVAARTDAVRNVRARRECGSRTRRTADTWACSRLRSIGGEIDGAALGRMDSFNLWERGVHRILVERSAASAAYKLVTEFLSMNARCAVQTNRS